MSNTLIARINDLKQYKKKEGKLVWIDPTINRWKNTYGNLKLSDLGIFIGKGKIYIGEVTNISDLKSIVFENVNEYDIQNDEFLQLNGVFPEYISRCKAAFQPFIHPKSISIKAVEKDITERNFINYYVINTEQFFLLNMQQFKANDRLVVVDNENVESIKIFNGKSLEIAPFDSLFKVKGLSLKDIYTINKKIKGRDSNNANRIKNIIDSLKKYNKYTFNTFFSYHDAFYNNRAYGELKNELNHFASNQFSSASKETMASKPLNQILYGPPGTGKTYNTINHALKIVDPEFYNLNKTNREELTKRFKELLIKDNEETKGQIAFCTFHQSFSYEDFVEGIKPKVDEKGDVKSVYYDIDAGIFKRICKLADSNNSTVKVIKEGKISWTETTFKEAAFFKLSLGEYNNPADRPIYEFCRENNYIAIGFGQENDFTGLSESEIVKKCEELQLEVTAAQQMNYFIHYLKKNNYVIISNGNKFVRAIGKVVGDYEYIADSPIRYNHFRKVEWLFVDENIPISELYERGLSQKTMYKIDESALKQDFFNNQGQKHVIEDKEEKKYVLIIDEINRGNVSQIFGELITLIENDKRAGKDEELEVILPYSKEPFKVPENVYIIGTMNTADRSVEALDTALRRRFSFTEMPPISELLSPSAMYCKLLWKYESLDWEDPEYLKKENLLFDFLGASEELKSKRKEIWEQMKKENNKSKFNYFDDSEFSGYNLETILETINQRVEVLLDRDHVIGHSYFMNIVNEEDLKLVFLNKIIPLLQEYFYHDYEKIALILGEGFVEYVEPKNNAVTFAKWTKTNNLSIPEVVPQFRLKKEIENIEEAVGLLLQR